MIVLLALSLPRSHTARGVGVALGASGTDTLVSAGLVETEGAVLARVVLALVQIITASQRVSSVSLLAQTLWGIGGCALRVEATLEPVTRTLTLVSIQVVEEERWRADADTLETLLVLLALVGRGAGDPNGRTSSIECVSDHSIGTATLKRAHCVLTESSEATGPREAHFALVDVHALSSDGIRLVSGGTCAVAHSSRHSHTLGRSSAVGWASAARQLASPILKFVRGKTLAAGASRAGLAAGKWISAVALGTFTVVAAGEVLADGVDAAEAFVVGAHGQALVDVLAAVGRGIVLVATTTNASKEEKMRVNISYVTVSI